MKTSKRSKMLLSSIAMLLVALVALGSATYAWYKVNTVVTANDLTVTASTPDGLLIKSGTGNSTDDLTTWTTEIDLANVTEKILPPTSLALPVASSETTAATATGVKYKAAARNAAALTGTSTAATAGTDYLTGTFEVVKTGTTAINTTMAATATSTDGSYVNFVVYDITADKVVAVSSDKDDMNGYVTASETTAQDFTAELTGSSAGKKFAGNTDSESSIAFAAAAKTVHQYVWYAWVDGQSANCTTDTASNSGIALSVTVTDNTTA